MSSAAFTFSSEGLPVAEVSRFRGIEAISRPYRFDVTLVLPAPPTEGEWERIVGSPAVLTFSGKAGPARCVHGMLTSARRGESSERGTARLRVQLAPRLWLLGRTSRSRIFQDATVQEIVARVLDEAKVRHSFRTLPPSAPRPYCVQYQESDLAFIERLLAEEGIFYFFDQPLSAGPEEVVFASSIDDYVELPEGSRLRVSARSGIEVSEHIASLSFARSVRAGATLLRTHDYEHPSFDPRIAHQVGSTVKVDESTLVVYDHRHDPWEAPIDATRAQRELEQARRSARRGRGEGTCRRFIPGSWYDLDEHPVAELNGRYVLERVEHEGHQSTTDGVAERPTYANRFRCVPAVVPMRPKRPPPRAVRQTETATVVGPAGSEVHTDALGRVKVQFHWDLDGRNDDAASCWIRTMQAWAGAAWGTQFIPRVGMEVVVTFTHGDADRPLVIGAVYNAVSPFPFQLPAGAAQSGVRTRSTPGGSGSNELRFDDAAGAEQVYLHAERDLVEQVGRDHASTVASERRIQIGANRDLDVRGDNVRTVHGNEVVTISRNLILHVVGKQIIQVDGQSTSGGEPAGEAAAADRGAPGDTPSSAGTDVGAGANSSASPEPGSRDDGPAATLSHEEAEAARARLLWAVESLPPEDYPIGRAFYDQVRDAARALAAVESSATDGFKVTELAARLEQLRGSLESRVLDALAANVSAPMTAARDAAAEALRLLHRNAGRLREALLSPPNSGVVRGGGGGVTPWTNAGDPAQSSSLTITGGGIIDSPQGLRINGQGAQLFLESNAIYGKADDIELNGNTNITLSAGESSITINASGIQISSGSIVKINGHPITLN